MTRKSRPFATYLVRDLQAEKGSCALFTIWGAPSQNTFNEGTTLRIFNVQPSPPSFGMLGITATDATRITEIPNSSVASVINEPRSVYTLTTAAECVQNGHSSVFDFVVVLVRIIETPNSRVLCLSDASDSLISLQINVLVAEGVVKVGFPWLAKEGETWALLNVRVTSFDAADGILSAAWNGQILATTAFAAKILRGANVSHLSHPAGEVRSWLGTAQAGAQLAALRGHLGNVAAAAGNIALAPVRQMRMTGTVSVLTCRISQFRPNLAWRGDLCAPPSAPSSRCALPLTVALEDGRVVVNADISLYGLWTILHLILAQNHDRVSRFWSSLEPSARATLASNEIEAAVQADDPTFDPGAYISRLCTAASSVAEPVFWERLSRSVGLVAMDFHICASRRRFPDLSEVCVVGVYAI